jgi:hypothetical protein
MYRDAQKKLALSEDTRANNATIDAFHQWGSLMQEGKCAEARLVLKAVPLVGSRRHVRHSTLNAALEQRR